MTGTELNLVWSTTIIEELVRHGITHFVISPGSRSTPLTVAAARHPEVSQTIHYDERGAAFYALGIARATAQPVVLVSTSGTAVANYFPAVVEASMDSVPLIILTADRPPELLDNGANQTIFQDHFFGNYVRWFFNLPTPVDEIDPRFLLTTIDQAVAQAGSPDPGPVHLNCRFREPLLGSENTKKLTEPDAWYSSEVPYTSMQPLKLHVEPSALTSVADKLSRAEKGIIIVGRNPVQTEVSAILELSEKLHWPIFPDIQSQLRLHDHDSLIYYYDLALLNETFINEISPEIILHFGGPYTSKRLMQWMKRHTDKPYILVHPDSKRIDVNHQVKERFQSGISNFCQGVIPHIRSNGNTEWLHRWQKLNTSIGHLLDSYFDDSDTILTEPLVSHLISRVLPADHNLVLASSMAIREMDMFAVVGEHTPDVYANRGASGIDGTLATAAGVRTGSQQGTSLLIGDLAFLHDLNSLALHIKSSTPLITIVINNDGGGIFNFLPVAEEQDVFESCFATPHGMTFEQAALLFGLNYSYCRDSDEFLSVYSAALKTDQPTLIEIRTERQANYHLHQDLYRKLSKHEMKL